MILGKADAVVILVAFGIMQILLIFANSENSASVKNRLQPSEVTLYSLEFYQESMRFKYLSSLISYQIQE